VLAVTGLNREARIIGGPGVVALASGGAIGGLEARIEAAASASCAGIISIGIAGALDPGLGVGDAVIATWIADGADRYATHDAWAAGLAAALPHAARGAIAGSNSMIVDAAAKARLRQATSALCVDMESHVAAKVAIRLGLPFAALRFISDGADRALPKAAQAGMKPDGGMNLAAVLMSLAADPRQLPALIRTGKEAQAAFRALLGGRDRLGPALGFADV
jgi:hopanoid-associated phosphorylase